MNETTLKNYHEIFNGAWKLFRKYSNVQTDEEWELLVKEAGEFKQQGEFARQIVMVVLDELDRRSNNEERTKGQ